MQIQDAADFAVEVHFAALKTASEENARVYLENPAGQSKAIRMHQTANLTWSPIFIFVMLSVSVKVPGRQTKIMLCRRSEREEISPGNDEFLFKHRLTIATLFPSFDLSSHGEICGKLMYSPAVAGAVCAAPLVNWRMRGHDRTCKL